MTDINFETIEEQWRIRSLADKGEKAAHKSISGTETAVISLGGIYKYCKHMRGNFTHRILYSKKHERS